MGLGTSASWLWVFGMGVAALLASGHAAAAQADAAAITLTARMAQVLQRVEGGHSPSPEEIAGAMDQPIPVKADMHTAVPLMVRALASPDKDVRAYTLTVLQGLESSPAQAQADTGEAAPAPANPIPTPAASAESAGTPPAAPVKAPVAGPSTFSPEIARELAPALPKLAAELTDESQTNRVLAASVLGGFGPNPPAGVSAALQAFLKRDDAVGPVGQAVVEDLLDFHPVSGETAQSMSSHAQLSQTQHQLLPGSEEVISRFLRRPDQALEARGDLIDAIAQRGDRSPAVNAVLLAYLDDEDAGVRSRLILSLPQLLLSQDLFADTKARISALADNTGESLRVVTAAKSVAICWTTVRMTTGCPAY